MKKLLSVLLALAMVLTLAACGKGSPSTNTPENQNSETKNNPEALNLPSYTFTQYGNGKITIVGAELTENDWGDDLLRIYYDYTNTDTSARGHYLNTALEFVSITQDGEKCETFHFDADDDMAVPEDQNDMLYVQPGCTSRNTINILCDPDGGAVEVSCYLMIGGWVYNANEIETFDFRIDLQNLMGAPAPATLAPILHPTYTRGLSAYGEYDYPLECTVSIDGFELTADYDGAIILRVNLTVTNDDESELSPMSMCCLEVYQDGVGLPWASVWDLEDPTDEDYAYTEDLYPGETVECSALFYLRNDHPVEPVIESPDSNLRLGTLFNLSDALQAMKNAEQAASDVLAAASAADKSIMQKLVGVWDRNDGWEDQLTFRSDLTGIHDMTGDKYGFTYYVQDGILYLIYDDGDELEYGVSFQGRDLILTDYFYEEEIPFIKAD